VKEMNLTRREFIRKGAVAAASSPLIVTIGHKAFAQGGDIKCAVIGLGRGRGTHLRNILKLDFTAVTAICDIKEDRLSSAAEMVKKANRPQDNPVKYRNYEDVVSSDNVDVVFIATPCDLHFQMIFAALVEGKSIYAEKPMATTVTDVNEIVRQARKSKGILQVGQQSRYSPSNQKAVGMIHGGKIGKVALINYQRFTAAQGYIRPEQTWIRSIERGGDIIVEQAVHELDRFNWIMGTHPLRAAGLGGQCVWFDPEGSENSDQYAVAFEYPGKSNVFYSHCWHSLDGVDPNKNVVYGTEKVWDMGNNRIYTRVPRGQKMPEPEIFDPGPRVDSTLECTTQFFECYREGKQPFVDAEIGRTTVLTALLGRKAFYEKRCVTWEDLLREGAPVKRWE